MDPRSIEDPTASRFGTGVPFPDHPPSQWGRKEIIGDEIEGGQVDSGMRSEWMDEESEIRKSEVEEVLRK